MCLDKILKTKPKPTGIGYKAFWVEPEGLYGEFARGEKPRPVEKWLKAENYSPTAKEKRTMADTEYVPGWHIFQTDVGMSSWMAGQIGWIIKKVKYKGAFLAGSWNNHEQVVAKEIYILP